MLTVFNRVRRAGAATVAAALGAVTLLAAPASAQTQADPLAPEIAWENCPEVVTEPAAECGSIDVPMHYSDPAGPTISVGFVRIPATGESRGTIFGNPGGPGGSVYPWMGNAELMPWPEAFKAEWDRVGVQPRGLPGSTPVDCTQDPGYDPAQMMLSSGAFVRDACELGTPGYTDSLTTSNTAEDWEMVRRALDLEQISILGLSYGTFLGSVYATRYPDRTDRLVLDSAMDPNLAWNALAESQGPGFEQTLHNFMAWTAERNHLYGLGETPLEVYQAWSAKVVAETGTNPTVVPPPAQVGDIPPGLEWAGQSAVDLLNATGKARVEADGVVSRALNPGAVQANSPTLAVTYASLPAPAAWDQLALIINGTEEAQLPHYSEEEMAEYTVAGAMQHLILCNENQTPPNPALLPEFLWVNFASLDPFASFPTSFGSGAACSGLEPVAGPEHLDGSELETRPLLVQGTDDPQTPYQYRHTLLNAMGAQEVTVHGPGHGHFANFNPAVDEIVVEYLRTGVAPATEAPGVSPN